MNQNEQMREALQAIEQECLRKINAETRLGEKDDRTFQRQGVINILHCAQLALKTTAQQALAAEPAPLVRLTEDEVQSSVTKYVQSGKCAWLGFRQDADGQFTVPFLTPIHYQLANAIMDAMIAKNGGKA